MEPGDPILPTIFFLIGSYILRAFFSLLRGNNCAMQQKNCAMQYKNYAMTIEKFRKRNENPLATTFFQKTIRGKTQYDESDVYL